MGALSLSHPQYSHLSKFGISPGISILNPDFKVAPIPGGLQTRSSSKVCRHGGAVPGDWAATGAKTSARDPLLHECAGGQTILRTAANAAQVRGPARPRAPGSCRV